MVKKNKIITLAEYFKVISNIQKQAIDDISEQIQKQIAPIKKVTSANQKLFNIINFEIKKAFGLIVDIEFGNSVIAKTKDSNLSIGFNKDRSYYNLDNKTLNLPLSIQSTKEINGITFVQETEYCIEAKINDVKVQKIIDQKVEDKVFDMQNKVMKLIEDKIEVKIIDVRPSHDRAELIFEFSNGKIEKLDFSGARIERAIIEALYGYEDDKYELFSKAEINSRLPNTLTQKEIKDAVYRINKKVRNKIKNSKLIKIVSKREIQLNKDF